MAICPIFKIFPYDTLFLLLPFYPFLIQGIAGVIVFSLTVTLTVEYTTRGWGVATCLPQDGLSSYHWLASRVIGGPCAY